jgi:hypothetical protein
MRFPDIHYHDAWPDIMEFCDEDGNELTDDELRERDRLRKLENDRDALEYYEEMREERGY